MKLLAEKFLMIHQAVSALAGNFHQDLKNMQLCFYRYPLLTDLYEDVTVYVDMSTVEGAGEGLFASRDIECGQLVSLFSGTKIYKDSNKRSVKYGDEEWSDFRWILNV